MDKATSSSDNSDSTGDEGFISINKKKRSVNIDVEKQKLFKMMSKLPIETDSMLLRPAVIDQPEDTDVEKKVETNENETDKLPHQASPVIELAYNTRALTKHAKTYQLEKFEKNAMIIFNHENIEGFSKRTGTDEDVEALCKTFSKFGFEITTRKDLSKVDLFNELKKFSEQDFTDFGCVVVVILTHGTGNGLLRARDEGQIYSEMDVFNQFKVRSKPTLVTKPVLLLIQACRGNASMQGVAAMVPYKVNTDHDDEPESYFLPVESDMLIIHSSFLGKRSYRPTTGSWFIQTLCSRINALYPTHDLESILTEVKRDVAINKYYMEYNHVTNQMDVNKQMPVVTSTLIRKLYLRRYLDSPPVLLPHRQLTPFDSVESTDDSATVTFGGQIDSRLSFPYYYNYVKRCLRHFTNENKDDTVAKGLLAIANLEDITNEVKAEATLSAMSNYLQTHCKKSDYYKYIYFYGEASNTDYMDQDEELNSSPRSLNLVTKSWVKLSQNNAVRGIATCIGACVIYNLLKK